MKDYELKRLIIDTFSTKESAKRLKELEKEYTTKLKGELEARDIEKQSFDDIGYKISYTTAVKNTMNEDKLIEVLKNIIEEAHRVGSPYLDELSSCIVNKPVIDEDRVYELLNKGILNTEDIQDAYEEKSYKTLRVTKIKK